MADRGMPPVVIPLSGRREIKYFPWTNRLRFILSCQWQSTLMASEKAEDIARAVINVFDTIYVLPSCSYTGQQQNVNRRLPSLVLDCQRNCIDTLKLVYTKRKSTISCTNF